jgi:hypothetical protein
MRASSELRRAIVLNGLQELSNATESGRQCCVTFQANENEHWLRCTSTRIDMDWPFAAPPAENATLKLCLGEAMQIQTWEADSFVRLFPACNNVDSLVTGIDSVFRELYGLGPEYALSYQIEELRPQSEQS